MPTHNTSPEDIIARPRVHAVRPSLEGLAQLLNECGSNNRDGISIIPLLRTHGDAVILVVSARDAVDEKVTALDLGADDFVSKPFDIEELLARLRVALRHHGLSETTQKIVRRGDLSINLGSGLID